MYLERMSSRVPPREGMEFLRDQGTSIGCYTTGYMQVLGKDGAPIKLQRQSWWQGLSALERRRQLHPTSCLHLRRGDEVLHEREQYQRSLRLYQATVAAADEQFFEYADCHPRTGMLAAVETVSNDEGAPHQAYAAGVSLLFLRFVRFSSHWQLVTRRRELLRHAASGVNRKSSTLSGTPILALLANNGIDRSRRADLYPPRAQSSRARAAIGEANGKHLCARPNA